MSHRKELSVHLGQLIIQRCLLDTAIIRKEPLTEVLSARLESAALPELHLLSHF